MATEEQKAKNQKDFDDTNRRVASLHATTADQIFNQAKYPRRGGIGGETTLGTELSWLPANFAEVKQQIVALRAAQEASTKALVGAIAALNKGEAFDQAKLVGAIRSEVAAGVAAGLGSLKVTGELTNVTIEAAPEVTP